MSPLSAVILLFMTAQAQDEFKKILEKIEGAKTASVKFTIDAAFKQGDQEQLSKMTGTLQLKQGNKSRYTIKSGEGEESTTICDGTRLKPGDEPAMEAPANRNALLLSALSRMGLFLSTRMGAYDPKSSEPQEVTAGPPEKELKSFKYKVKVGADPVDVQIWVDSKSLLLVRRVLRAKSGQGHLFITETYEQFTLNGEIPDDAFKLP